MVFVLFEGAGRSKNGSTVTSASPPSVTLLAELDVLPVVSENAAAVELALVLEADLLSSFVAVSELESSTSLSWQLL